MFAFGQLDEFLYSFADVRYQTFRAIKIAGALFLWLTVKISSHFSGRHIECIYFQFDWVQDGDWPSTWKFQMSISLEPVSDQLRVWF